MKIKKGDNVIVTTGRDKGKKGTVVKTFRDLDKVIVDGLNMRKKHQKPKRRGEKGQTIEIAMPMHVSNVMIVDPKGGKRTRVGYKVEDGKKIRIARKSGAKI